MRIAIAADERTGVADGLAAALAARGHDVVAAHGALNEDERDDWAWASAAAAHDVSGGARKWNDANVLALSLRTTSAAELDEILDAWFAAAPYPRLRSLTTSRASAKCNSGRKSAECNSHSHCSASLGTNLYRTPRNILRPSPRLCRGP